MQQLHDTVVVVVRILPAKVLLFPEAAKGERGFFSWGGSKKKKGAAARSLLSFHCVPNALEIIKWHPINV